MLNTSVSDSETIRLMYAFVNPVVRGLNIDTGEKSGL